MFQIFSSLFNANNASPKPQSAGFSMKELGEGIAKAAASMAEGLFSSVGGPAQADFSQLSIPQRPDSKPSLSAQMQGMVRRAQQILLGNRVKEASISTSTSSEG